VLERQLSNVKTSFGAPIEEIGLNFTLPGDPSIELKPEGAKTTVTLENLQEYIDLTLHYTFHETIKLQLNAFKKGFNSIFSLESLKCFSYLEIEELICGEKQEEWNDVQKLAEIVVPAHGYYHKSPQF
jgi:E3 ubiquitin-protein ligase TRIP12